MYRLYLRLFQKLSNVFNNTVLFWGYFLGPLCLNPQYSLDCLNDGICKEDDIGNSTFCVCTLPYEGPLCEFNKTFACSPDACMNNATCTEDPNGISCLCVPGKQIINLYPHPS